MAVAVQINFRGTDNASRVANNVRVQINNIGTAARDSTGSFNAMREVAVGAFREIGAIATRTALQGIQAVAGALVDSVNVASEFEATLSGVEAVLSPTADEMAALRQEAIDLGASTAFSANQSAEAIEVLAKNGLTTTEILNGAVEAALNLAAATGADLPIAADISTDAMAIFGISAEEMTQAIDGISAVVVNSKFDINDYALALAQGGGVAGAVGVTFDDFNTTIAAISPLFKSGSDAGTSYKVMLQRLIPASGPAAAAMRELGLLGTDWIAIAEEMGISTDLSTEAIKQQAAQMLEAQTGLKAGTADFTNAWNALLGDFDTNVFFDRNGDLKDGAEISRILAEATADLTEEQKNAAFQTIFGTDAMRAAFGMAEAGEIAYVDLKTAMAETGLTQEQLSAAFEDGVATQFEVMQAQMGLTSAAQQAAVRLDNFAGAMEQLNGATETLQIAIGSALLPILTQLVNETIVPAIQEVIKLTDSILSAEEPLQAFSASVETIIPGFESFLSKLHDVRTTLQPLIDLIGNNLEPILISTAGVITGVVVVALASMVASFAPVVLAVTGAIAIGAMLVAAWQNNFFGIRDLITGVMTTIQHVVTTVLMFVQHFWTEHGAQIEASTSGIWTRIQSIISVALELIQTVVTAVLEIVAGIITEHGDFIGAVISSVWTLITTTIDTSLAVIEGIITTIMQLIQGDWDGAWNTIKDTTSTVLRNITTIVTTQIELVKTIFTQAFESIRLGVQVQLNNIVEFVVLTFQAVKTSILNQVGAITAAAADVGRGIVSGITGAISAGLDSIKNAAKNAAQSALDAAMDLLDMGSPSRVFRDEVGVNMMLGWMEGIRDSTPALLATVEEVTDEMLDQVERATAGITDLIRDTLTGQASIARQAAQNLRDFAEFTVPTIQDMDIRNQLERDLRTAQDMAEQFLDPDLGAEFFREESRRLFEIAELEAELRRAGTQAERDIIQEQLDLVRQAQAIERRLFEETARARREETEAVFADLPEIFRELIPPELFDSLEEAGLFALETREALQAALLPATTTAPTTTGTATTAMPSTVSNTLTIAIDARGAQRGVDREIEGAVRRVLREQGLLTDTFTRTRR